MCRIFLRGALTLVKIIYFLCYRYIRGEDCMNEEQENTKIPEQIAAEEFEQVQRTNVVRTLTKKRSAIGG